ncbi:kynureninase [Cryphonectria parasitica EP155]|uniref:Kynureninase n=1 Tax=Cryphonectria parasitica (strain ATCC 38755 / EP155) TaxID=660469 RepID=A0A9P4Y239_CRYP1|nr:kynureninase [Cryphonectria parasitica EP155]KAF3765211.1 kynureninase [Cryphonectria parasitica EP155]
MVISATADKIRAGQAPAFEDSLEYAQSLDASDSLRHLRDDYLFPTKASLKSKSLQKEDESCIYFCGNSLGLQSRTTRRFINAQLDTWAAIGVNGHFVDLENSPLVNWQDMSADCARKSADFMGALPSEIVYMNTLTVNIHMLLASFYRPTQKRHKIILEWKPFPSDYYAISSHIRWHNLDPAQSMVEVWPPEENLYISTAQILATIDAHADETAVILLPGIQYYSGQFFDIPTITKYAQDRGIVVGWDLAHAAGNVDLKLHDWNVDFAMWCTYKYINAGPGSIAGAFVHDRHGKVEWTTGAESEDGQPKPTFRPRLSGWYGGDQSVRFQMAKQFQPTPGASGFQAGNPSALDLAALSGSLTKFEEAGFQNLRSKSLVLTAYAEYMLYRILADEKKGDAVDDKPAFMIITPSSPAERGAQLSVLLREGLLDKILADFQEKAIICDKRKPDVIRVAPVPMYNSFEDVWRFMEALRLALGITKQ